jgi:hypothetical protein
VAAAFPWDAFTVTLNRLAALAAIEDREVFDTRFGTGSTS